jgi:uncharacterized protein YjiS (DUF1127 family)
MSLTAASFSLRSPARPRLSALVRFLVGGVLRRLAAWKDRVHLHALRDHTLRDVGLWRDQIDDVLRGAVCRL